MVVTINDKHLVCKDLSSLLTTRDISAGMPYNSGIVESLNCVQHSIQSFIIDPAVKEDMRIAL